MSIPGSTYQLEFMMGKDAHSKVIMVSSLNPGSGKTFITMNLSTSLAVKSKKFWR